MSSKLDQDLDELLGRHLAECLDGQLGRAAAAFRATGAPRARRIRLLLWGAGAALAAGLAIAWALVALHDAAPRHTPSPRDVALKSDEPDAVPVVQSTTWTPVTDDGTALVNDQPVRQLRRQIVDEYEWYDARDNATVRRRMPREQYILIGLQTD